MRKTKSFGYSVLMFLLATIAAVAGVLIMIGIIFTIVESPIGDVVSNSEILVLLVTILAYVGALFLGIWMTRLLAKVLGCVLLRDVLECNSSTYPEMAYILKNNDQARELNLSNMRTGGDIPVERDKYTVCVGFTKAEMCIAEYVLDNRHHGVCWEVPNSFILPDKVTCLAGVKVSLKDILWALQEMRDDDTVFFVYTRSYPSKKSQLAHSSREGEIVIIDIDINRSKSIVPEGASELSDTVI